MAREMQELEGIDGVAVVAPLLPRETPTQLVSHGPAYLIGRRLGEILAVTAGLTAEKLEEALAQQRERGGRLGELLISLKTVTDEQVMHALAVQLDLPFSARLPIEEITPELIRKLPI